MNRRDFLWTTTASTLTPLLPSTEPAKSYDGPNVIIVRFGGGVRRRESIGPDSGFAPFLNRVLAPRGVLFPRMEIEGGRGNRTGHGEGTLNILTGTYDDYVAGDEKAASGRFESKVPTMFETLRAEYNVPRHQALMISGEDRAAEGLYALGHRHLHGAWTRATVLSPDRFQMFLLRSELGKGKIPEADRIATNARLAAMEALDIRSPDDPAVRVELDRFWTAWSEYYGRTGLVSPRGDRLLAELAIWAMRRLKPRLMMVEFQDPDHAHSGIKSHYTRGVTIVDEGLRRIDEETRAEPFYRDRTVLVVVPDCGRDNNPLAPCPFQHHGNSRTAREIFCLFAGPGIERGRTVDRRVGQEAVAGTIAKIMKFPMPTAAKPLVEVLG